jgi:predicted GH43/DUF377 family glycosyl hydrolase
MAATLLSLMLLVGQPSAASDDAGVRREAGRSIVRLEIGPHDVGCLVAEQAPLPAPPPSKPVDAATMQRIYDEVKTPVKHGIIVRGEDGNAVDCPCVFRHNNKWYMLYVTMNKVGYETLLAESDDLLFWRKRGAVLPFRKTGWDAWQAGGFVALQDTTWGGSHTLEKFDGRYWGTYVGGALQGYETDPLSIGAMTTTDPSKPVPWTRLPEPILAPQQADARAFESLTLYKSNVIRDPAQSLGWPLVMFYNAKAASGYERIGMAVSRDMHSWHRFGKQPVIDNGSGISGDPQIVRIGDVWVMFYFGAFWRPGAFDTFACSRDLATWTKWTGPDLVAPSEPWDKQYAHKPWVVKHDGVVYHYYCAVGDQGRTIALATSKDLKRPAPARATGSARVPLAPPVLPARSMAKPSATRRGDP